MPDNKEMRALFAAFAMQEFLKHDLALPIEASLGREWVAEQAFLVADSMVKRANRESEPSKKS